MALHLRRRREAPPLLWTFFCSEWLGLSRQTTQQWWLALSRARWSRPGSLKTVFLCRAALRSAQGAVKHFVTQNVTPHGLVDVLEDLRKEQLIGADLAREIERSVLEKTHASGLWK